jgi:hypothetical protein
MDENQLMAEIQRQRVEMDANRNELFNSRGYYRTALPITSSEGLTQWNQLSPEEKAKYEHAARGSGIPGATLFFSGYRQKIA